MTPREKTILAFMGLAEGVGLDPAVILPDTCPPYSVELRIVRDGQVRAAMRAYIESGAWWHYYPARTPGWPQYTWRVRQVGPVGRVTAEDLQALDHWWAQAPGTGRPHRPRPPHKLADTPAWMRPGSTPIGAKHQ